MKGWLWNATVITTIAPLLLVVGCNGLEVETPDAQLEDVDRLQSSDEQTRLPQPNAISEPGSKPNFVASSSLIEGQLPVPLIPPTSVDGRLRQIQAGRGDPFASLATTAAVVVRPIQAEQSNDFLPSVPVSASPLLPPVPVATIPVTALPPASFNPPNPVATSPNVPLPAVSPAAPPLDDPMPLARSIEISGVVEIGGQTSVIVRVPNELSSRYVRVGERLGNGHVLVKRVDLETSTEPVVILEQDGVEIVRTVGSVGDRLSAL